MTEEASAMARYYTGEVAQDLVDVRGDTRFAGEDYSESQQLGRQMLKQGAYGLVYDSVRHPGGTNIAILRPPGTTPVTQRGHCVLKWNGQAFTGYLMAGDFVPLQGS